MIQILLATQALATTIPLTHTSWEVHVSGHLADIEIEQVFHNESSEFIESTYIFPLDTDAAVDDMSIQIGNRIIDGDIRTRDDARRLYDRAKDDGKLTALTEQERPNVFTQSVANIPPGNDVIVRLHVVQPVEWVDGHYELVVPLVVGPRFVENTPDADRISPPVSREDTGLRVDIEVDIEAGLPLWTLESPTHAIESVMDETGGRIAALDLAADKDFVLRWTPDADQPASSAIRQGGHVLLNVIPPRLPARNDVVPREIIWVVDTSCSMNGAPLDMAKDAMKQAFEIMDARDSFWVLNFSDAVSTLSSRPLQATPENIARGRRFVESYNAEGGTSMLAGIEAALDLPYGNDRERFVVFLTDGYIGDEEQILAAIEDKVGAARLFSFGIGSSVNRYLLDEMSIAGRGKVTYVTLDESPGAAVNRLLSTISKPVLTDILVDWRDWEVDGMYPQQMPDLFDGQPLDMAAMVYAGSGPITITGRIGSGRFEETIDVVETHNGHAVASTWARHYIAELERQQRWGQDPETKERITTTALEYQLLTRYTSFVAVEHIVRNATGKLNTVDQPIDTPEGVDFEAAVSRRQTPPGDPLLTVHAPIDARAVMAIFPWQTVQLRWDDLRERWFHRFLVPRDIAEGPMQIEIMVVQADGTIERKVEIIIVDAQAPEIDAELVWTKTGTDVVIHAEEPIRAIQVQPVGRPDLRRRVDFLPNEDHWDHTLTLSGQWDEVAIIIKDRAMNTLMVTVVR